ncbi:MAG: nucleotide sugar dehydrogenase, partial [Pseudomonadota bacterium]
MLDLSQSRLAVVGLGYVGLPVAAAFGRCRPVVGFDPSEQRIAALTTGQDVTGEVSSDDLAAARHLAFTTDPMMLRECDVFIIAVPTPVDEAKRPDLSHLDAASRTVGAAMRPGAIVIYESTVYPGCTRDFCAPILAEVSGLALNEDFFLGYSPERANPGDTVHRLATITKVTAGSTPEAAEAIDGLYGEIVTAGTHKAASIEVAEAAKVI